MIEFEEVTIQDDMGYSEESPQARAGWACGVGCENGMCCGLGCGNGVGGFCGTGCAK